jgi:hypothetical protein
MFLLRYFNFYKYKNVHYSFWIDICTAIHNQSTLITGTATPVQYSLTCLGLSFDHHQGYTQFVYNNETKVNMAYVGHTWTSTVIIQWLHMYIHIYCIHMPQHISHVYIATYCIHMSLYSNFLTYIKVAFCGILHKLNFTWVRNGHVMIECAVTWWACFDRMGCDVMGISW